jgi:molybdopterin-guanine dinucleotide biosynthesis protein A
LVAGRPEPLFARYGRACLHAVRAALDHGRFKAADLVRQLDPDWIDEATLRSVDPDLRFLTNVNTREDLARYA